MSIKLRAYNHPADYDLIGNFLVEHYKPGNADGNWIQPAWEYMHGHPALDRLGSGKITGRSPLWRIMNGLWEKHSSNSILTTGI
jgi:hypothetical protein